MQVVTVSPAALNAFCRLRDLVFCEMSGVKEQYQVYRFLDFANKSREFDASEIAKMVERGYPKG